MFREEYAEGEGPRWYSWKLSKGAPIVCNYQWFGYGKTIYPVYNTVVLPQEKK